MAKEDPKMEARPPAVIDRVVRTLIPPAVREEVVGDLWERYRSPLQYLSGALRILPYVLASQVRRSTNRPLFATQAFLLFGCLGGFVGTDPTRATVIDAPRWEGAAIGAIAALVGLMSRDAYRGTEQWTVRRGLFDILTVAACVFVSQLVLATLAVGPGWLLSATRALLFVIAALPGLLVLRLALGLDGNLRASALGGDLSVDGLQRDYRDFQRRVRVRNNMFVAVGLVIVLTGAAFLSQVVKPPPIGYAFITGHLLVVAYIALMGAARAMPAPIAFKTALAHYRAELERQHRLFRFMWWWFLLPLFFGIATQAIRPGITSGETLRAGLGAAAVLLLALCIAMLSRDRTRIFRAKLATLVAVVEQ
jgi:hypothetical protein